jgi:dTDP-glucose pyrophosphorylase
MNVFIPIGGIGTYAPNNNNQGSRFKKLGYRYPKPFINIVGRPMLYWIIDRLSLTSSDTLWIAISTKIAEEMQLASQLRKEYPKIEIRLVLLDFDTRGAAETLLIMTNAMNEEQMGRKTISLDCDMIYFEDVLKRVRELPEDAGACVYFEDTGKDEIFSYIKLDADSRILEIKEKVWSSFPLIFTERDIA